MSGLQLEGKRFGRLTALKRAPNKGHHTLWVCLCDCGEEKTVFTDALRKGRTKSCGCLNRELLSKRATHGRRSDPIYYVYHSMINRCYLPSDTNFCRYGAKGVTVCDHWKESFENFLDDMGDRPTKNHSIDRIANSKGYEKSNCRWATKTQQANNKTNNRLITIGDRSLSLKEWAKNSGLKLATIRSRYYNYGWRGEMLLAPLQTERWEG